MGWLDSLRGRLIDLIDLAPEAVRPGLLAAVVVVVLWALLRRRRAVWNWLVRAIATVIDVAVGVLLLPELAVTTSRRTHGRPPPTWTATTSQVADRLLDGAATARQSHLPAPRSGKVPVRPVIVIVAISIAVFVVMRERPTPELGDAALQLWRGWLAVRGWIQP